MSTATCSTCLSDFPLEEFARIEPYKPDTIEQCHPFMEMKYTCNSCEEIKETKDGKAPDESKKKQQTE